MAVQQDGLSLSLSLSLSLVSVCVNGSLYDEDDDDHVPNELIELHGLTGKNGTYTAEKNGFITFKGRGLGKDFRIVKVVIKSTIKIDVLVEEDSVKRKVRLVPTGQTDTFEANIDDSVCLLYTSPSPRDLSTSRMPSSA